MADVPVQLVVAAFDDEGAADEALKELKIAKRERLVGIQSAAVLRKDEGGKLHIKETSDMGPAKGAAIGGALGAGIGLIAEAALAAPLVVGGLLGALAARLRDSGFSDERLERLGENLPPGSSLLVAVVEHTWVEEVEKVLAERAADVLTDELSADIVDQLQAHHDATYTALRTEGSVTLGQHIVDDEGASGAVVSVSEKGVAGGAYTATEDGVAVVAGEGDEEGAGGIAVVAEADADADEDAEDAEDEGEQT